MTDEPKSITTSRWYQLRPPYAKPDIWDLCIGNGQHLAWDRCWAFVLTHNLSSRELGIVWSIAYAVKSACEQRTDELLAEVEDLQSKLEDANVTIRTYAGVPEPGSLAYAQHQAAAVGDLDDETEEETR